MVLLNSLCIDSIKPSPTSSVPAEGSKGFANGKLKEAKDYAQQAFSLKQDYADVLIALSQIAKAENNNADALSYAKMAFTISPQDQNLAQYIDSLKNSSSIIKDDSVKDKNN